MANHKGSRWGRIWKSARALWDESALVSHVELSKLEKFAHFCLMVWRSFTRNRCPVRASALAYATLLALIPMLAVVMSVTSSFLKKEGEDQIDQFIVRLVATVTPPAMVSTNVVATTTNLAAAWTNAATTGTNAATEAAISAPGTTNTAAATGGDESPSESKELRNEKRLPSFARDEEAVKARKQIARRINEFIQNTRSGTLGLTGSVLLIFVGISMLGRIEETFNDIWGVGRGRNWFTRIWLYWGVISLAPLLLVVALGLPPGGH
jgi:membrane protein